MILAIIIIVPIIVLICVGFGYVLGISQSHE